MATYPRGTLEGEATGWLAGGSEARRPEPLARPKDKHRARIEHLARLEENHRARVKILNSIEDRKLNNTLRQMDFAKSTLKRRLAKQARSFEHSLVNINQRIADIRQRLDDDSKVEADQEGAESEKDTTELPSPPATEGLTPGTAHGPVPFSFRDRRREPFGRWIRYPPDFRPPSSRPSNQATRLTDTLSSRSQTAFFYERQASRFANE